MIHNKLFLSIRFVSKMFHPNVYADGGICLDILQNRWSPTYDVSAILTSIQSLLDEPNPNSPANSVAAQLYQVILYIWSKICWQLLSTNLYQSKKNCSIRELKSPCFWK